MRECQRLPHHPPLLNRVPYNHHSMIIPELPLQKTTHHFHPPRVTVTCSGPQIFLRVNPRRPLSCPWKGPARMAWTGATRSSHARFATDPLATSTFFKTTSEPIPVKSPSSAKSVISASRVTIISRPICVCTPVRNPTVAPIVTVNLCKWPICGDI